MQWASFFGGILIGGFLFSLVAFVIGSFFGYLMPKQNEISKDHNIGSLLECVKASKMKCGEMFIMTTSISRCSDDNDDDSDFLGDTDPSLTESLVGPSFRNGDLN